MNGPADQVLILLLNRQEGDIQSSKTCPYEGRVQRSKDQPFLLARYGRNGPPCESHHPLNSVRIIMMLMRMLPSGTEVPRSYE